MQHDFMFVSPQPGKRAGEHSRDDPQAEPWQHLIDEAARLSQATMIEEKSTLALLHALEMAWVRPYGPMTYLESDQEGGLVSEAAKVYIWPGLA